MKKLRITANRCTDPKEDIAVSRELPEYILSEQDFCQHGRSFIYNFQLLRLSVQFFVFTRYVSALFLVLRSDYVIFHAYVYAYDNAHI